MEKVLILGLGNNNGGKSSLLYFASKPDKYIVRVSDIAPKSNFKFIDEFKDMNVEFFFSDQDPKENIKWADVVIKNPAIPSKLPQLSLAHHISNDIAYLTTSEYVKNTHIITVTGTKGKSSTASAITHALKHLNKDVIICGNIGISAFTVLTELENRARQKIPMPDYIVIEMSSWQINDTYIALNAKMPKIKLAIFTSIYSDHLNSYKSKEEYLLDKIKLFNTNCEIILIENKIKKYFALQRPQLVKRVITFPKDNNPYISNKIELQCAYRSLKLLKFKDSDIHNALFTYKGIPHRCEQVDVIDDIMFINDSAATIPEAASYSCKNISPLSYHIIMGGSDKKLTTLGIRFAARKASTITLLDGNYTQNKLIPYLEKHNYNYTGPFRSMQEAFDSAYTLAKEVKANTNKMQVVILSPGATSFELFTNEFDRGDKFKACVHNINNEANQ